MSIDKAIENAAASVQMEGYTIDNNSKELVRLVLENKITMEQFIKLIKEKAGVAV